MRYQLFIGAAVAALAIPAAAGAQETTSIIRGTVTSNGEPVAGATVVATNVPSGTRSSTTTGSDGQFSLAGLRVGGPYTVEVTSDQGSSQITDIYTVVQQAYQLPIDLADSGAQDIVVTASSIVGAGTKSDGPQTILTQRDIAKVASVNRDIRDIERRDPFANIDLSNGGARGGAVSFAGVNPRFNRFTINGVTVGDSFGLNQDASPTNRGPIPFDAIAQVSVSVAPYDFRQSGFQGGAIDTVLLSGTNEYHLTGFYSQNTDGLSGSSASGSSITLPNYTSQTYGVTISGPIIKDKLFFMVSGERNTDPRPISPQPSQIPGFSTTQLTNTAAIAGGSRYGITGDAFGEVLTINPRLDEKIVGRIDWNITDGQKLSISYINSFDSLVSPNNNSTSTSTPALSLSSNAYYLTELLHAGIAQLNSDWTDNFSTEARFIYRSYTRGQEPLGGRGNSQFQICQDPTSVGAIGSSAATGCSSGTPRIFFGPDNFRQTNALFTDTWAGSLLSRLTLGNHELKFLAEFTENRTFNNFVPNSLGSYYFDSLADFQAGNANQVLYAAVVTGGPNGAAANFHYDEWSFGIQDDWNPTPDLTITYGFRWDLFGERGTPVFNPGFQSRYNFPNTGTYKGLEIFQPRASFSWKVSPIFKLRGGAGIFGGGSPDIYLSNSYSNTVTTNALTITRSATGAGCTGAPGLTASICAAALNNVGANVNPAFAAYASGGSANLLTNTGALDPNFRLPSSVKATLSGDLDLFGIHFGADYYYSNTINGIFFRDIRSVRVGTLPDGRPRYNNISGTFTDNNYDILVTNTSGGRSHIGVVRFDKKFDFGLSLAGSYTLQDVRDVGSATSSTINSNYRFQLFADPNTPQLGTSDNQVKWLWKYSVGYDHAFFGDYRTVIQFFGETRAGRPYSYVFLDNTSSRSTVFGTVLTPNAPTNLLYVPTSTSDPLIAYDNATTRDSLDALINSTQLSKYRGQIAPKNIARTRSFTTVDLHVEQQIPTFVGRSRITLFADINNLPNLLNRNWGTLYTQGFPPVAAVVQVSCLGPTGTTALSGAIGSATNPTNGCSRYLYSSYRPPNQTVVFDGSLYSIRLGVRFTW